MNIERVIDAVSAVWNSSVVSTGKSGNEKVEAISRNVLGLFPKFEQVAFYTEDISKAKQMYRTLGCREWTDDLVTARGKVGIKEQHISDTIINVAELSFNYDLGTELELIHYASGMNWHRLNLRVDEDGVPHGRGMFLSHMSYHVEDLSGEMLKFQRAGFKVVQDVTTVSHTNPYLLKNGRKYRYVIFDTVAVLGFDLKLIKRVEGK